MIKRENYEVPHYVFFFILLLLPLFYVRPDQSYVRKKTDISLIRTNVTDKVNVCHRPSSVVPTVLILFIIRAR